MSPVCAEKYRTIDPFTASAVSLVMYYPFLRIWDNLKYCEEQASKSNKETISQPVTEQITS